MAECPFCFALLNTADILRGKLKACPRCGKSLALGAADQPAAAAPAAPPTTAPPAPLRPAVPPTAKLEQPVRAAPIRPPTPPPTRARNEDEQEAGAEQPSAIARLARMDGVTLAAFLLVSVASLLASIPPFEFVGKLLGAAAFVVALFGSLLPAVQSGRSPTFPIVVCVLGLAVFAFMGRWPRVAPSMPQGPMALPLNPHAQEGPKEIKEGEWVDASKSMIRDEGWRVQVLAVRRIPVEMLGRAKPPKMKGKLLSVQLQVSPDDTRLTPRKYESWADRPGDASKHPPTLSDTAGKVLPQIAVEVSKLDDKAAVGKSTAAAPPVDEPPAPGVKSVPTPVRAGPAPVLAQSNLKAQPSEDTLYFTLPESDNDLKLELPGSALGLQGTLRFELPRGMIQDS